MRRRLCVAEAGQRIVPPFAGDAVSAVDHVTADHHAAADTGAEDHAEDHVALPGGGAVDGLAQGQAVGIIRHAHRAGQARGDVRRERAAIHAEEVRITMQPGLRVRASGGTDPHRCAPRAPERRVGLRHQSRHRIHQRRILPRARHARAQCLGPVGAQGQHLGLGTADVEPDAVHAGSAPRVEPISWKNSAREAGFVRNDPYSLLVVVMAFGCCTPR